MNVKTWSSVFLGALAFLTLAGPARASHGEAVVSDIDGCGNGTFNGTYVHANGANVDHPWYTFHTNAGSTVTITITSTWDTYMWIYEVADGCAQVGDRSAVNGGTDLVLRQQNGPVTGTQIFTFVATTTNQYIIQLDSFIGADGPFTLVISGSTNPCNAGCGPPPPPPPSPGDEGSFGRSAGPTGSEGSFGQRGSGLSMPPPATPVLAGPFHDGPQHLRVYNVSFGQAQAGSAAALPARTEVPLLWFAIAALSLVLLTALAHGAKQVREIS